MLQNYNTSGSPSGSGCLLYDWEKSKLKALKQKKKTYKVYKRRYYMLMVYGWVTLFNAGCRVNVQSIRALVRELYGANHIDTQIISAMYAALFLPGVIVATIWYNKWSIRTGLIIGAALQAFGAGAKWLIGYGFYWVYIGQAFWALANPFINLFLHVLQPHGLKIQNGY